MQDNKITFNLLTLLLVLFSLNLGIEMAKHIIRPFLGYATKATSSEAKQYVGSMNRGQQAYFAENATFADNIIEDLQIGVKSQTDHYNYSLETTKMAAFSYAIPRQDARRTVSFGLFSWKQKFEFKGKSYVGTVFLVPDIEKNQKELTTISIICEANLPGQKIPAKPVLRRGVPNCGSETSQIGK